MQGLFGGPASFHLSSSCRRRYPSELDPFRNDRVRRNLLRSLACLSNDALSIVRIRGRLVHHPQAQRHYATVEIVGYH